MADEFDFEQVLEVDLANIVKKSAAGQPLTARERDLIQAERTKRAKEKPSPKAPSEKKSRSGRSAKTGFEFDYNFYAERYGASRRTVMRWVKIGKEKKPDPVPIPLDAPNAMRKWWAACMDLRCPPGIIAAEVKYLTENRDVVLAPEVEEELVPIPIATEEEGLEGALKRLTRLEVEFSRRATEPGQAKNWFDAISRMTSLATNVRKELENEGKLVLKIEVEAEIKAFHGQIISLLKSYLDESQCREIFELLNEEVFQ